MKPVFVHIGRLPGMNEIIEENRKGFECGNDLKQTYTNLIAMEMRQQRVPRYGRPVRIHFIWHEPPTPNGKYRDFDNVVAAKKFVLDAMDHKHAKVIHDDSLDHVVQIIDEVVKEPKGRDYGFSMFIEEVESGW